MKILVTDIETAPMTLRGFGLRDQNFSIDQIVDNGGMLSVAARWHGQRKVEFRAKWDGGERALVRRAAELLDEADVVIGWNSAKFDTRWIQAQAARFGIPRPSPYVNVDLMRSARRYWALPSYKLDFVARFLGVGKKLSTGGFELWADVMDGDESARALMKRYNIQDTKLTDDVFVRMRELGCIHGMPNHAIDGGHVCPHCGGEKLQARGFNHSKTRRYQRWQCRSCFGWSQSVACEPGGAKLKAVA
jgi:DNA polymerase elongation subunit (family B)